MSAAAGPGVALDRALGRWPMDRLTAAVLAVVWLVAVVESALGVLTFAPTALVAGLAVAVATTLGTTWLACRAVGARPHVMSSLITALLLALLFPPSLAAADLASLGLAGVVAGASKVVLAPRGRHVLNPAAVGALVAGLVAWPAWGGLTAVWWVGTPALLPVLLLGAVLVVRRTGTWPEVAAFLLVGGAVAVGVLVGDGAGIAAAAWRVLASYPLLFAAAFMLTEPLTAPPRRAARIGVAVLAGVLSALPFTLGPVSTSPELALVLGNLVTAALVRHTGTSARVVGIRQVVPGTTEVTLQPRRPVRWRSGQWAEVQVDHRADARGTRRVLSLMPAADGAVAVAFTAREPLSTFKRALLTDGARVRLVRTGGDFVLPGRADEPVLLVAGGIGVTPFVAHVLSGAADGRDAVVVLVARRDQPYADELRRAGARVVLLPEVSSAGLLAQVPGLAGRTAYVAGSPAMVHAARAALRGAGVRRVRTDSFSGY